MKWSDRYRGTCGWRGDVIAKWDVLCIRWMLRRRLR
jgi:hypothetical protein